MGDLSKRRIYVMDCGGFVKIGVSNNTERRRNQIPFEIKQYYCTEPIHKAFAFEKIAHKAFRKYRLKTEKGREYFNICFDEACKYIRFLLALYYGINMQEIFSEIFSQLSKESRVMAITYLIALRDKEKK